MRDLRREALNSKQDILALALSREMADTVISAEPNKELDDIIIVAYRLGATREMERRLDKYDYLVQRYAEIVEKYIDAKENR